MKFSSAFFALALVVAAPLSAAKNSLVATPVAIVANQTMVTPVAIVANQTMANQTMVNQTMANPTKANQTMANQALTIYEIVEASSKHKTLQAAIMAAKYVSLLNGSQPFTLFAPTDKAFTAFNTSTSGYLSTLLKPAFLPLLQNLLQYHLLNGTFMSTDLTAGPVTMLNGDTASISLSNGVMINNATVITPNIPASNGVVHVINMVLVPDWANRTIVDAAVHNPLLTTLVDLIKTAGLVGTLNGPGPFTAFAPVNTAFKEQNITALKANKTALAQLLLFHVHKGIVTSADLKDGMVLTMMNGNGARIAKINGTYFIAGAPIISPDHLANNGVGHIISKVMNDTGLTPAPTAAPTTAPTTAPGGSPLTQPNPNPSAYSPTPGGSPTSGGGKPTAYSAATTSFAAGGSLVAFVASMALIIVA